MECLMPLLAPDRLAESLHESNSRLEILLDGLIPDATTDGTTDATANGTKGPAQDGAETRREPYAATPQQMGGLLSELMRAGESLRALPPVKDAALEEEIGKHRRIAERLRELMPVIHRALLRERARLEQERTRLGSTAAWAQSSRQTL
jgi:hypothetical protein